MLHDATVSLIVFDHVWMALLLDIIAACKGSFIDSMDGTWAALRFNLFHLSQPFAYNSLSGSIHPRTMLSSSLSKRCCLTRRLFISQHSIGTLHDC